MENGEDRWILRTHNMLPIVPDRTFSYYNIIPISYTHLKSHPVSLQIQNKIKNLFRSQPTYLRIYYHTIYSRSILNLF